MDRLCAQCESLDALFALVLKAVLEETEGNGNVAWAMIEIHLSKAAMYGEAVSYKKEHSLDERGGVVQERQCFGVIGIAVMTLVGINACERTARQPVLADIDLQFAGPVVHSGNLITYLFKLENLLAKVSRCSSCCSSCCF